MNMRVESVFGGDIEYSQLRGLVGHNGFQRLGFKRQLGTVGWVFRSASHTRLCHSLGTMDGTRYITDRWRARGWITEQMQRDIMVAALLHDIGHTAYCHQLEDELEGDHNQNALRLLPDFRRAMHDYGADYDVVRGILADKKHPLAAPIKHPVLGTDPLDYLWRDARVTVGGSRLPVRRLFDHIYYEDGQLIADLEIIDEVIQSMREYIYMYRNVYRLPLCQVIQRFMQKLVRMLLNGGELTEEVAWGLVDDELTSLLMNSKIPSVVELHRRLVDGRVPLPVVVIRDEAFVHEERRGHDSLCVYGVPRDVFATFDALNQRELNEEAERGVAAIAGVNPGTVLVIPVVDFRRFVAPDVQIRDPGHWTRSLRTMRPSHYKAVEEEALGYCAVRVCVAEEDRERVASERVAKRIRDYLLELVSRTSTAA